MSASLALASGRVMLSQFPLSGSDKHAAEGANFIRRKREKMENFTFSSGCLDCLADLLEAFVLCVCVCVYVCVCVCVCVSVCVCVLCMCPFLYDLVKLNCERKCG